jgi:2-hydroxy-3-keto-5-methylthiopentenyl-1-phosphate phosphatase
MVHLDERLRKLSDRDTFNEVVDSGWKSLIENGRIMESDMAIDRYVKVFTEPSKSQIAFDLL